MKTHKIYLVTLILTCFFQLRVSAQIPETDSKPKVLIMNNIMFPSEIGNVNDFEQIFDKNQIQELENIISDYEKKTSREIAIFTVKSIEPYDNMKDYAQDLSNRWGLGKEAKNNGLTIIFSSQRKEVRISTGPAAKKILTDAMCKEIIDNVMIPKFKQGAYYAGLKNGVQEIISRWSS